MERTGDRDGVTSGSHRDRDHEERILLTMAMMRLFDLWQLTNQQKLELMGYSIRCSQIFRRYRRGGAIQKNSDAIPRVRHLLGIYRRLNEIFPDDPERMRDWLLTPHEDLQGKKPLDVMRWKKNEGLLRVKTILGY